MAGIEDFVVEQILTDFQQSGAPQPMGMQPPQMQPAAPGQPQSSFLQEAQYNALANRGMAPGATTDPRSPQGITFSDPAQLDRYSQYIGQQNAASTTGNAIERAMRERDIAKQKIMEGLKGLDPQIQGAILKRLGIDPGPIKSELDQQKELATHRASLSAPQQEIENAIKMMLATQGGRQNMAELSMKQQQFDAEQASRGQTQNIQLMRVLATLMQSDASGKMATTLGPLLMQMLQGAGINLTPSTAQGASAGGRAGIRITRED